MRGTRIAVIAALTMLAAACTTSGGQWFLSWPQYLQGSALHAAVQAGPGGSTFVSPSSLAASTATAPLGTAPASNASAR